MTYSPKITQRKWSLFGAISAVVGWFRKRPALKELRLMQADVDLFVQSFGPNEILTDGLWKIREDMKMAHLIVTTSHSPTGITAALETYAAMRKTWFDGYSLMLRRLEAAGISVR